MGYSSLIAHPSPARSESAASSSSAGSREHWKRPAQPRDSAREAAGAFQNDQHHPDGDPTGPGRAEARVISKIKENATSYLLKM